MPITLHPDRGAVVSGAAVTFEAKVSGATAGPLQLTLTGPCGTPLPQTIRVQIAGNGKGRGTFAPVTFAEKASLITTLTCAAGDGSAAAGIAVVAVHKKAGR